VLAVGKRKIAQVLAVIHEQVKSIEARLTATEHQVSELRIAFFVQAYYLAIEHCASGLALPARLVRQKQENNGRCATSPMRKKASCVI
jgi:hypothetical protein